MEIVSTALKNASLADTRETKAVVEFLIQNTPFPSGTTVSTNGEASVSNKDSILEGIRVADLIANFENSGFLLDGNYYLPTLTGKYGWWSDILSNESGIWVSNPFVQINMSSTYVDRITIIWGQKEYPLEYKVIVNGSTTYNLTDADDNIIVINANVTTLKVEIVKWFEGYKRAKIQCIDLGVTKIYTDEDIVDLTITEQCDHMGIDLPSNDMSVTIDNIGKDFDILNPTGYYELLADQAPINIYLGHITDEGTQYVQMGKFFLNEYQQNKSQMTFSAIDILSKLDQIEYRGFFQPDEINYTAKSTITKIMTDLGLTNEQYIIPNSLDIPEGNTFYWQGRGWSSPYKLQTGKDILKRIMIYYGCNIWVDRQGKIVFDFFNDKSTYFFPANQPTGNEIAFENCYSKPQVKKIEKLFSVNYYAEATLGGSSTPQLLASTKEYQVVNGSDILVKTSQPVGDFVNFTFTPSTTGTAAVVSLIPGQWGVLIKTSGTGTIVFELEHIPREFDNAWDITVDTQGLIQTVWNKYAIDISYILETKGYVLDLYLGRAFDIFDYEPYFFEYYILEWLFEKNKTYEYEAEWRQDITNNLGDIVVIENEFGIEKNMIITFQQYKYNGALKGITKGVGN
jgi:hypothetical protein